MKTSTSAVALAAGLAIAAAAFASTPAVAVDEAAEAALRALAGRGGDEQAAGAAAGRPLDRYRVVLERPLFSPSRRAPDAAPEPQPLMTDDLPTLHGVMLAKGRRVALIDPGDASGARRVAEGSQLGRWTVESIKADRIVLRTDDGTTTTVLLWAAADGI